MDDVAKRVVHLKRPRAAIGTWPPMTLRSRYAPSRTPGRSAISANFSCLEFRRTGIALPLFTAWARSPCGVAAAYDEGCRFGSRRFLRGLAD
jgi:hypothetical protein